MIYKLVNMFQSTGRGWLLPNARGMRAANFE